MKWESLIDSRILLYKTETERKKLIIDFSENMEDYETEFVIQTNEIIFFPRKN